MQPIAVACMNILIAGAGPTGLTAAIELARRGYRARIISANDGPVHESRGLGISRRSLRILEPCGATERLLPMGLRVEGLHLRTAQKELFHIPLPGAADPIPSLLVVQQSRIEEVLVEALWDYGIEVEWRTRLETVNDPGSPEVRVRGARGVEIAMPDLLIAADGAHSLVRHQLGIAFPGGGYEAEWGLADVRVTTDLPLNEVHIFDFAPVLFVMIPIRDNLVRFFSDHRNVLDHVPQRITVKSIEWESPFRISHRQAETYQKGSVFLAGDAAHIHSPIGARGMNLGIEDAAWLAWLIAQRRTERYTAERWPVGRHVLKTVDPATRLMASDQGFLKFARRHVLPHVITLAPLRRRIIGRMVGADTREPPWLGT
jgi:2-polyprenyl-6-methoxyphenol hydroxylase-like FAD-dependent oxidoreductase